MSEEIFLTTESAADLLKVTTRTIIRYCKSGLLEGAEKGAFSWSIPQASVLKLQAQRSAKKTMPHIKKQNLRFPIGNTNFKEIIETSYYIDKSLLIRDLIEDNSKVILFTRPRRFGKTLALDMLKTFFEQSKEDSLHYFTGLAIYKSGAKYLRHQGKYPVVQLSLKDIQQLNWQDAYGMLKFVLGREYFKHPELKSSPKLDEYYKAYYSRIVNNTATDAEWRSSLQILVEMLTSYYGEKAIVIIDEYDTPIQNGFLHGYYEEIVNFMRTWFAAALKDNDNIFKAILTGILRVSKESLFSGLNHLKVNGVLDREYCSYFGFTQAEVADIAKTLDCTEKLPELQEWYDGYLFGDTEIYNPWSVIRYFDSKYSALPYWANTSENAILHSILQSLDAQTAIELKALLQDETITTRLDFNMIYPQLHEEPHTVYSFLLMAGYLKAKGEPFLVNDAWYCSLCVPNQEIRGIYKQEIIKWLNDYLHSRIVYGIELALINNKPQQLQEYLQSFMLGSISFFDTSNESFYHGLVLGLTAIMDYAYHITSNREAGLGRFDLQLEPRSTHNKLPGIILELKYSKAASMEQLEKLAEQALQHIEAKAYATELKVNGVKNIIAYGIAFCGKTASVKQKTFEQR